MKKYHHFMLSDGTSLVGRIGEAQRSPFRSTRNLVQWLAIPLVGLLVIFLMGCGPRLESLKASPRLTFDALQEGKVALMPAAAKATEVSLQELTRIDVVQAAAFDAHAHGLRRSPSPLVANGIRSRFANWDTVVRFADTAKADIEALAWLSAATGARYLVFTHLEYREIQNSFTEFEAWVEEKHGSSGVAPWTSPCNRPPNYESAGSWTLHTTRVTHFWGQACTTSELIGVVSLIDSKTGSTPWVAKHRVTRAVGNTSNDPKPSLLAWTLFGEVFARLPEPK